MVIFKTEIFRRYAKFKFRKILISKVLKFRYFYLDFKKSFCCQIIENGIYYHFVVRGYHVYKDIWAAEIGSELSCFVEPHNREDRYAVAVMDNTSIVGHVLRKISYICYIFLLHSGSIICRVTGPKQYSRDLDWMCHVSTDFTRRTNVSR